MRKKTFITITVAMLMIFVMATPALGLVENKLLALPANQVWTAINGDSRSLRYSYALARCESVYPDSGIDLFTKIRVRLIGGPRTSVISDLPAVTLTEGASEYSKIYIREGFLNENYIYFQFSGNSNDAANAVVSYNGN